MARPDAVPAIGILFLGHSITSAHENLAMLRVTPARGRACCVSRWSSPSLLLCHKVEELVDRLGDRFGVVAPLAGEIARADEGGDFARSTPTEFLAAERLSLRIDLDHMSA